MNVVDEQISLEKSYIVTTHGSQIILSCLLLNHAQNKVQKNSPVHKHFAFPVDMLFNIL